jgi:ferredoxin
MRKSILIALAGILFVAAGLILLEQPRAFAQDEPEEPPFLVEYYFAWAESPHADTTAEAFNHWNDEGEVEIDCAKCHSTTGYRDFVGADGSEFGVVDAAPPVGTVVTCDACHAPTATQLTSVTFPSGVELGETGDSARCMVCHQGRASTDSVNAKLEELGLVENPNQPSEELRFINIHYYAAAATLYGGAARGGYQYDGQVYMGRNMHVEGFTTCADCHNPHTTEVKVEACATCHEDVESADDLRDIRMQGSDIYFDGDGDDGEGIADEIVGMQELLMEAMQAYAAEVAGTPIAYDAVRYPYFFVDTNENGSVDDDEAVSENGFKAFTANLERAAYNYQVSIKDPGAFAHNPQYIIQLLYDSTASLNEQLGEPVDMTEVYRDAPMHFNPTTEAFNHWNEEGEVPGTCARCHSAEGLPVFIKNGVNIAAPLSQGLACTTCHTDLSDFSLQPVEEVTFPSGAKLTFGEEEESNLCLACHQGRESTVSVNRAISSAGVGDDEVSESLAFRNIHYFAAGASLFGNEAQGAYQFEGKEYNGRNLHAEDAPNTCADCHRPHNGTIRINECEDCHDEVEEPEDVLLIRMLEDVDLIDYDGDGDSEEPIRDEIGTLEEALYAAIQSYASETIGTAIAYDAHTHPYWYIDTNANGTADPEEVNSDNRYVTWTPNLLRTAYNYQYSQKDPGDFAHNPDYIMQILYDSIEVAGGDVSSYTRPPVAESE